MAMVTFGGAYAVLAYVAQQAVEHYGWLKPGEMLDGLGMAETTPGPLIMVLQFVGFMAAYPRSRRAFADAGRNARRAARDLGDVHALLPVDLPRRAVRGEAARQQIAQRSLVGPHGCRGRRDLEPRHLVRDPHGLSRKPCRCARSRFAFDAPVLTSVDGWALALSVAAAVAIFRFKVGMIQTLAACCAAGIVLHLAGAIA